MLKKRLWIALLAIPITLASLLVVGAQKPHLANASGVIDPTCTNSLPCIEYDNKGSGPGVKSTSAKGGGLVGVTMFNSTSSINGTFGVFGNDLSTSGSFDSGVHGASIRGTGVSGTSAGGAGVIGKSTNGNGIEGFTANSFSDGVLGSNSTNGTGVVGESTNGFGVNGKSSTATGVNGSSTSGDGVAGFSTKFNGVEGSSPYQGVYGTSTVGTGVYGNSIKGTGTSGYTQNPSKTTGYSAYGIFGNDASTDGGTLNSGALGESTNGTGVFGRSTNGTGVSGLSSHWVGVNADGGFSTFGSYYPALSVVGDGSGDLIDACAAGTNPCHSGLGLAPAVFDVDPAGDVSIAGKIFTAGSCNLGCAPTASAGEKRVRFYTAQESLPTVEDFGEAQLVNGQAYVRIDRAFANTMDPTAAYMVFITPEGPSRGLYVTQKSTTGFAVRENPGGNSTLAFSYRIVAKPFGEHPVRLQMITMALPRTPTRSKPF